MDASFLPTFCTLLAANSAAASVCKTKFYTSSAANLLMWGLINFSICYAATLSTRVIGGANFATIDSLGLAGYPGFNTVAVAYHAALSIFASSLVLKAGAGSMNWLPLMIFSICWTIGVYAPLTHWQSNTGLAQKGGDGGNIGWMSAGSTAGYGVLDHAGAHHIHMAAGASALVLAFCMGNLKTAVAAESADSVFWTLFGMTGYLVLGDPNSGSGGSGPTLVNILMAVATAVLTATTIDVLVVQHGKGAPTSAAVVRGITLGLISMTAAGSLISPMWAAFFGFATVLLITIVDSAMALTGLVGLGQNSVFSVHFLGAAISSALTGLWTNPTYSGGVIAGSFYGNSVQLGRQCGGIAAVLLEASVATAIIYAFVFIVGLAIKVPVHPPAEKKEAVLTSAA